MESTKYLCSLIISQERDASQSGDERGGAVSCFMPLDDKKRTPLDVAIEFKKDMVRDLLEVMLEAEASRRST